MNIDNAMVNVTTFAFDFDNTISRDPKTFLKVMEEFEKSGHTVYVVTARLPEVYPDDYQFLVDKGYRVFCTAHQNKRGFMKNLGISIDVWVDDCPEAILQDWDGQARTYRDL